MMTKTEEWRLFSEWLKRESVEWDLFTVLEVNWSEGLVRRSYSSDESNYPSGGIKKLMETEWANQVIHQQRAFTANDATSFRAAFSDFELLESMGLCFALNVPIVEDGRTVRTINLLRSTSAFGDQDLVRIRSISQPERNELGHPL